MLLPKKESTTESQSHRGKPNSLFSDFLCASVTLWLMLVPFPSIGAAQSITFRDVTSQAGIHFTHNNGAFGKKWLPETMGPGCAFIDYDNDGYPDILLINGDDFPGHQHASATTP